MAYNTYYESMRDFLRWAETRISEEVKKNEELEKALEQSPAPIEKNYDGFLTKEQKLEVVQQIDDLRSTKNITANEAAASIGFTATTYYKYRKQLQLPTTNYKRKWSKK